MFELVICHAIANQLSFYRAAEGDAWRKEQSARARYQAAWSLCRAWLIREGLRETFLRSGRYLMNKEGL